MDQVDGSAPVLVPVDGGDGFERDVEAADPGAVRRSITEEFLLALWSSTTAQGVPYAEGTLTAYRDAVVALDRWMTREGIDGDFTCATGCC